MVCVQLSTRHDDSRTRDRDEPCRDSDRAGGAESKEFNPTARALLRLQGTAGNRAVVNALARRPQPPVRVQRDEEQNDEDLGQWQGGAPATPGETPATPEETTPPAGAEGTPPDEYFARGPGSPVEEARKRCPKLNEKVAKWIFPLMRAAMDDVLEDPVTGKIPPIPPVKVRSTLTTDDHLHYDYYHKTPRGRKDFSEKVTVDRDDQGRIRFNAVLIFWDEGHEVQIGSWTATLEGSGSGARIQPSGSTTVPSQQGRREAPA